MPKFFSNYIKMISNDTKKYTKKELNIWNENKKEYELSDKKTKKYTKEELNTYKKNYKKEYELLNKYVNFNDNKYRIIYNFFLYWGTYKDKDYKTFSKNPLFEKVFKDTDFHELTSQISIYEGIFITLLLNSLMKKSNKKNISVLEIGLAYGTSAMFINNVLNQYPNKNINYISMDPGQKVQWSNVGLYNIARIKKDFIKTEHINEFSHKGMKILYKRKEKYDFIFIDGGHTYEIVYSDSKYADKLININGLVVHDDVLHYGVKKAIQRFYIEENPDSYIRVVLNPQNLNEYIQTNEEMYLPKNKIKSFSNPKTMYAFQKIK